MGIDFTAFGTCLALLAAASFIWKSALRPKPLKLEHETVLITGAGGGLGSAVALALVKQKCKHIILWDLYPAALERCKEVLLQAGGSWEKGHLNQIITQTVDVSSNDKIRAAIDDLHTMGVDDVSILISNAGVVAPAYLTDFDDRLLVKSFEVNVFAFCRLVKLLLPGMLERNHGTIVNISSITGHLGVPKGTLYTASKAAVSTAHECLVHEVRDYAGIRTLLCEFGHIRTPMFQGFSVSRMSNWLLPTLDPQMCADRIVRCVKEGHAGILVAPTLYWTWPLYNVLPIWGRRFICRVTGAYTGLEKVDVSPACGK